MSAPGGMCESCGMPMSWTFAHGELWVRCEGCPDLLAENFSKPVVQKVQEARARERREASEDEFPF
uniref:Uncharacterized protein n=1 Tax=uncultured marine virus TaxID=186617 RepID=A0A1J0KK92_9VIRU|nr:hypothetical protein [uncultured marine virus]